MITQLANVVIGIYAPFKFRETNYLGYDITTLKDEFRAIEILANRDGETGGTIGLRFNGKVCDFTELPYPNDPDMAKIYEEIIDKRKKEQEAKSITVKPLKEDTSLFSFFHMSLTK